MTDFRFVSDGLGQTRVIHFPRDKECDEIVSRPTEMGGDQHQFFCRCRGVIPYDRGVEEIVVFYTPLHGVTFFFLLRSDKVGHTMVWHTHQNRKACNEIGSRPMKMGRNKHQFFCPGCRMVFPHNRGAEEIVVSRTQKRIWGNEDDQLTLLVS